MPWTLTRCPDKQYLLNYIKTLDPENEIFDNSLIENQDIMPTVRVPWRLIYILIISSKHIKINFLKKITMNRYDVNQNRRKFDSI